MRARTLTLIACATTALGASAPQAFAQAEAGRPPAAEAPAVEPAKTGGAVFGPDDPSLTATVPGTRAVLLPNGMAAAPEGAPQAVKQAIWAANKLIGKPYKYGGGHAKLEDSGYDCSGTVSYALAGGSLLKRPRDSSSFMRWGRKGKGKWITVYTNPGHAFAVIAGLRLDTSAAGDPSGAKGPRWRPTLRRTSGFKARRLPGY